MPTTSSEWDAFLQRMQSVFELVLSAHEETDKARFEQLKAAIKAVDERVERFENRTDASGQHLALLADKGLDRKWAILVAVLAAVAGAVAVALLSHLSWR